MGRGRNRRQIKSSNHNIYCIKCNYCGRIFSANNERLVDKLSKRHLNNCTKIENTSEELQLVLQKAIQLEKELKSKGKYIACIYSQIITQA